MTVISLSSLDAQRLVALCTPCVHSGAHTPADLCSVLCSIVKITQLLAGSDFTRIPSASKPGVFSSVCPILAQFLTIFQKCLGVATIWGKWSLCFTVPQSLLESVLDTQIPGSPP